MSGLAWSAAQRRLHWGVALAVLLALLSGWAMTALPDQARLARFLAYQGHKNLGVVILAATMARLLLRVTRPRPPWPAALSAARIRLAELGHATLYGALVVVPLLGYVANCAAPTGIPILLGLMWPVPAILDPSAPLYAVVRPLHVAAALGLSTLALGHAALAVHHHRHGVPLLRRMWGG